MSRRPRVTVLLPTYNAAPFLDATLASLSRQTFDDFEILAIDDGSADGTQEVLKASREPRLRAVLHERNAGLATRLNEGLADARGELVARLDADDIAHPDRLSRQVAVLDAHRDLALLGTNKINIDERGRYTSAGFCPTGEHEIAWFLCADNPFCHPSVMFRRSVVAAELHGYDVRLRYCEDFDMWARLLRAGFRARNLADVLVAYRRHGGSMTASRPELRREINFNVIRENLQHMLPREDRPALDQFARAVAGVHFGERPVTGEFVETYLHYAECFVRDRGLARRTLRRVIAHFLLRWGSLARHTNSKLAIRCACRVAGLAPGQFSSLVLPGPIRGLLARRAGRFWDASPAAAPDPA